jgi:translation initiation factor 4E
MAQSPPAPVPVHMSAVKHPLAYAWTFWLEPDARCAHKHKRWLDSLTKLPSFDFVEDFWGLWAVLPRPSVLLDSSIYLFRSDRPPSWELFPGGGKWVATGAELDIDMAWELLCLAMLGEQLEEDICGGVCSARRLSVWTRGGPSAQLSDRLTALLGLSAQVSFTFKEHRAAPETQATHSSVPGSK